MHGGMSASVSVSVAVAVAVAVWLCVWLCVCVCVCVCVTTALTAPVVVMVWVHIVQAAAARREMKLKTRIRQLKGKLREKGVEVRHFKGGKPRAHTTSAD